MIDIQHFIDLDYVTDTRKSRRKGTNIEITTIKQLSYIVYRTYVYKISLISF